MNGFLGADTAQLRDQANALRVQAQRLLELRETLDPLVMDTSMWRGEDAEAFRSRWSGQTAPRFAGQGEELRRLGAELDRHAEQQDEASGAGAGTGPGGGGGGAGGSDDGFNPLGFLGELAVGAQGIFSGVDKMRDFLRRIPSAADEFAALADNGLDLLWRQTYLDEAFNAGSGFQKYAESLLGKLNIPTAIGRFEPLSVLNQLDEVAPFLADTGRILGNALPVLDAGLGFHQMFTADNGYDQFSGGLSGVGGTLMMIAPFTGPAAPILGAIGAGMGVVSLGMDVGKLVYENWDNITGAVGDAWDATTGFVGDAAGAVSDTIGNAGEAVADTVSDIGSTVSDGIGAVGDVLGF